MDSTPYNVYYVLVFSGHEPDYIHHIEGPLNKREAHYYQKGVNRGSEFAFIFERDQDLYEELTEKTPIFNRSWDEVAKDFRRWRKGLWKIHGYDWREPQEDETDK